MSYAESRYELEVTIQAERVERLRGDLKRAEHQLADIRGRKAAWVDFFAKSISFGAHKSESPAEERDRRDSGA